MYWKLTLLILVSVFQLDHGRAQQGCSNIPNSLRFDCYPEGDANEQSCVNRGCCWAKPTIEEENVHVPLDIPYCFYPNDYGYQVVNKEKTQTGYLLSLTKKGHPGPYGNEIENLAVDVRFETKDRLHFKVYDPNNNRYEVPIVTPKVETEATSLDYSVTVTNFPFGIAVTRKSSGTVVFNSSVGGMTFENQFLQMSSLLPSDVLYGLGEHSAPLLLDVKWQRASLFARDVATPEGFNYNLYGVHPFYVSLERDGNANGVFLLNSNAMDIVLQPTPAITFRTIGGVLDFYVFLGPTPDLVVQQYTEVVGRPTMPPYWGLGFHLCRWGYGSLNGTETVNANMRRYGIPQDVQWNDIEYMDRHLDFTVDQSKWSGLGDFVKKLHNNYHQHYIPIVDPGISSEQPAGQYRPYDIGRSMGVFVSSSSGEPIIGKVWPGETVFPDFTYPVTQSYWDQMLTEFRELVEFDGLWIDMNEPSNFVDGSTKGCPETSLDNPPYAPHVLGGTLKGKTLCMSARHHNYSHYDVHSLYGLTEAKNTMSALEKIRGKRSVVISRSTFPSAGLHGGHWLGDNTASFNDLYLSIPGILNFNLFGVPLVGADICGFNGNTNKELCGRWMQLGAFYPFSRNHNTKNANPQDPAAFGDDFAHMARDVLLTRYALLPYLYTLFAHSHMRGSAVARPLFYEFPSDSQTYAIDKQFLLGPALLITPVLTQGSTSVTGYFPDATWYDGTDGSILQTQGGKTHTLSAPWDKINFHFRGGYVIPTQMPSITTYYSRQNPFQLTVCLSSSGEAMGDLFYDDGESLDPIVSAPYLYVIYAVSEGTLKATVDPKSSYHPEPLLMNLGVFGVSSAPKSVTVNDHPIESFSYSASTKVVSVTDLKLPMDKGFTIQWS